MVAGVAAMNLEYQIKKDIPQEQDALNDYIQELCFCDKHIKPVPHSPTQLILPTGFPGPQAGALLQRIVALPDLQCPCIPVYPSDNPSD